MRSVDPEQRVLSGLICTRFDLSCFFGQLLTTKARHSIMLMILSKFYQDIKQEKNRRLVGFCFSLHTKAASRGNLFFVYSIYAKLDAD